MFELEKYRVKEDTIEVLNKTMEKVNGQLISFDIDKFLNKKGLFKRTQYINLYDAYYLYYSICMDITPEIEELVEEAEVIQTALEELENFENIYENKLRDILIKKKEYTEELTEIKKSLETLTNTDYEYIDLKTREEQLERLLVDMDLSITLANQENLQMFLIRDVNRQLKESVQQLTEHVIPNWKKQVKTSIELMSAKNKLEMNKKLSTEEFSVQQEIEKLRLAREEIRDTDFTLNLKDSKD